MDKSCFSSSQEKARYYTRIKYSLMMAETGFFLAFCFFWLISGLSVRLADIVVRITAVQTSFIAGPAYCAILFLIYYILVFPEIFYQTFLLEHQFGLSKQTVKSWFLDQAKSGILAYVLSTVCLVAFYWALSACPLSWWLCMAAGWIIFNVVLAYLVPVLIVPMFYRYKRLPDGPLRVRLSRLADTMGIRLLDISYLDLSTRTTKANAALMGLGPTKRVVLSDTMQTAYTDDEICVIVAHEFAHSRHNHVMKLMLASACLAAGFFYIAFKTSQAALSWWGLSSLADPAAIPLICLFISLLGIVSQPAVNAFARHCESEADRSAIEAAGSAGAFISAMEKLAGQNLSDPNPPAWMVWLFYSHPPISERIARARAAQR